MNKDLKYELELRYMAFECGLDYDEACNYMKKQASLGKKQCIFACQKGKEGLMRVFFANLGFISEIDMNSAQHASEDNSKIVVTLVNLNL